MRATRTGEWIRTGSPRSSPTWSATPSSTSPAGTVVEIRTRGEEGAVVLEVHNWGEPIAPERLPHLFKPLSRGAGKVDMETRSIGLGLYIVESIVHAHGGSIAVRSTAEEGTLFTVRLPRHPQPGGSPTVPSIDFEQLFRLSSNAYMVLDRGLRYVAANEAYLQGSHGQPAGGLVKRHVFETANDPGRTTTPTAA